MCCKTLLFSSSAILALILVLAMTGCQTGGQTGALAGGGIGALAGQAIGGDTKATLIGAAVGAGVGYIIGNEKDKQKAQQMSQAQPPAQATHTEVGPLGNTRWRVVSMRPSNVVPAYTSKILEFKPNGRVITTTTKPDGSVVVFDESFRVVGDTLIINKPGYLLNARFNIEADQLVVSAEDFSAVLNRL